jgi:ribosome-binding protein aMBF1 (putative translation factor)
MARRKAGSLLSGVLNTLKSDEPFLFGSSSIEEVAMVIGRFGRIRFARQRLGLSQAALGALCGGMSQHDISAVECGRLLPSKAQLQQMAEALHLTPAELLQPAVVILDSETQVRVDELTQLVAEVAR